MLGEMRRYLGLGLAWLGATAVSVLIASAAVAGIRDRVVETPVAIGLPTSTTTTVVSGNSALDPAPVANVPETSTATPSPTTTAAPPASTTTTTVLVADETVPATTTTTAPPPTTTTTPPTTTVPIAYPTYDLVGGTVVLSIGDGEVNLVSATPRPGFSVDYEHTGPEEVEVRFVSSDHKSKLEADVENGELRVDIDEEPHDEDDD